MYKQRIIIVDPNKEHAMKFRKALQARFKIMTNIELQHSPEFICQEVDLIILHESFRDTPYLELDSPDSRYESVILMSEGLTDDILLEYYNKKYPIIGRQADFSVWKTIVDGMLARRRNRIEYERCQLDLIFTFNQTSRHIFYQKWLAEQKAKGKRIFVLPLKPLYFWNYKAEFHDGPDLSDMILQLEQEIKLSENELGIIFEKQKSGIFLPRPGKNSEDIFSYDNQSLLKFCRLFSNFLNIQETNSIGLFDIEAVPFHLVNEIASLCNKCHIDLVEERNFGNRIAKEEIASFLAKKNSRVQFSAIDF